MYQVKLKHRDMLSYWLGFMSSSTLEAIEKMEISKGNVIEVARIAGFMAAKENCLFDTYVSSD